MKGCLYIYNRKKKLNKSYRKGKVIQYNQTSLNRFRLINNSKALVIQKTKKLNEKYIYNGKQFTNISRKNILVIIMINFKTMAF